MHRLQPVLIALTHHTARDGPCNIRAKQIYYSIKTMYIYCNMSALGRYVCHVCACPAGHDGRWHDELLLLFRWGGPSAARRQECWGLICG